MLADPIGCEDGPTWLYYGNKSSIGRLGISNRDFARLGLLCLPRRRFLLSADPFVLDFCTVLNPGEDFS